MDGTLTGGVGMYCTSESAPYGMYFITNGARVLTEAAMRSVSVSLMPYLTTRGINVSLLFLHDYSRTIRTVQLGKRNALCG